MIRKLQKIEIRLNAELAKCVYGAFFLEVAATI
jgi:hypothetical protein